MDTQILKTVQSLKKTFEKEGFVIDGIFGSFARNEETHLSDLDLLYHLERPFFEKYEGFSGFKRLDEIKNYIMQKTQKRVDLAPKNNLSQTAKKYILDEVIYV